MKTVTYRQHDGSDVTVEYDETAPCLTCDLPVVDASMGGTRICPWCDCGRYRDGCDWHYVFVNGRMEPVFPHEHERGAA